MSYFKAIGSIVPVRVLGVFALVDEGELDWKVVALNKEEAENKNV
jgi:Inorganic pyrophosphatase